MVKFNSVTGPGMDDMMHRVQGTELGLDVLRKDVTDIGNRLSALEIKVDKLIEKFDNFIEFAARYVQHCHPQFKACSMQLLGGQ